MKIMFFYVVPQTTGAIYYGRGTAIMIALTDEAFDWFETKVMDFVPAEVRMNAVAGRATVTGTTVMDASSETRPSIDPEEAARRAYVEDPTPGPSWKHLDPASKNAWCRIASAAHGHDL